MFGAYRSGHEVNAQVMQPLGAAVVIGELAPDSSRVRAELRRRSRHFHLEMDSAGFLAPFAGTLSDLFPDAKFIMTIRDCFSWLDARIELHLHDDALGVPHRGVLRTFLAHRMQHDGDTFAPEEAPLRDAGLSPIASYFRFWTRSSEDVLAGVPTQRLLVVRTEDLDRSADVVARFAGVPGATVRPVHANHRTDRFGLLADVPIEFVVARAQEHCTAMMERYWGSQWANLAVRLPTT